jgi:cytochrome c peroxidase
MALANVAYAASLTWANPVLLQLEHQAITPIFGERPVELGLRGKEELLVERLRSDDRYRALLPAAFPRRPQSVAQAPRTPLLD